MTITNGYGTLTEFVNRYLPGTTTTTAQNASIERIIQAVSRLIDLETHRQFWATASQARVFTSPKYTDMCWIDDAVTVTAVALDLDQDGVYEQALVLGTDYVLKPDNAAARGLPYTQIQMLPGSAYTIPHHDQGVQVTGTWGYCAGTGTTTATKTFTATSAQFVFISSLNQMIQDGNGHDNGLYTDDNNDGVFETHWAYTDFALQPAGSGAFSWIEVKAGGAHTFPTAANGVQVNGAWNNPAAPDTIQEACYIQSYRQYLRNATPFGIAGSGEMGVMTAITALDPDVARMIAPYIDYGGRE
jgi:hypothetical protein